MKPCHVLRRAATRNHRFRASPTAASLSHSTQCPAVCFVAIAVGLRLRPSFILQPFAVKPGFFLAPNVPLCAVSYRIPIAVGLRLRPSPTTSSPVVKLVLTPPCFPCCSLRPA